MTESEDAARAEIAKYEALGDKYYNEMYDSRSPAACYSEFKYQFAQAIFAAEKANLHDEAKRLQAKYTHCQKVYRSQFADF